MISCCRTLILLMLLNTAWFNGTAAATEDGQDLPHEIDRIFSEYDSPNVPGCALGIVRDGALSYARGYGSASLELGIPLTSTSAFNLASLSKQFTAASVVLAAEQGYLSLEDDIREYIPELPSYGHKITLREMLNHTSGFREYVELLRLAGGYSEDIHTEPEILSLIQRQKALNNDPGTDFNYSNTNYFLLSLVIRRTTGKSLAQFAQENIFTPLKMSHTHFHDDRTRVVANRVTAYSTTPAGEFKLEWTINDDQVGAGGLMSSVEDLVLWDRNFYANKLGSGTLLRELQTPGVLNNGRYIQYGLGLVLNSYRGLPAVEHSGGMLGFRTEFLRFPQQGLSVILLCNVDSVKTIILAERIADLYLARQEQPATAVLHVDARRFEGHYRDPQSHSVLDVSEVDGKVEADGERFNAVAPLQFEADTGYEKLSFETKAGEPVAVIVTYPDAVPMRFEKFAPIQPSFEDLEQYAGEYGTRDLPATYRFAVDNGHLTLAINWRKFLNLIPSVHDEFQEPTLNIALRFHRNVAGKIDGFDLFNYQVRHIAFAKNSSLSH